MYIHVCDQCGFEAHGKTEIEAEIAFDNHSCGNEEPVPDTLKEAAENIEVTWHPVAPVHAKGDRICQAAIYQEGSLIPLETRKLGEVIDVAIAIGRELNMSVHLTQSTGLRPHYVEKLYDPKNDPYKQEKEQAEYVENSNV